MHALYHEDFGIPNFYQSTISPIFSFQLQAPTLTARIRPTQS